jgi:excisionase family DNA binding protein
MEQRAFSLKEVADILGVHPETIRRAVKAGKLKAAKIGKDYRIAKTEVDRYFQAMGGGSLFEDNDTESK